MGEEKNTLTTGSGEAYEWLINLGEQQASSTYPTGSQTRYDPATRLPEANTGSGPAIKLSPDDLIPYLAGPTITGTVIGDPTSPAGQYFPFHNHDDYKATNDGDYPGGMFTMLETLP